MRRVGLWVAAAAAVLLASCSLSGKSGSDAGASASASPSASHGAGTPSPSASASPGGWYTGSYTPAQFAAQVKARAKEAGVDAQLVMAVLYNEDYKPHDPAFERQWQKIKPDAAFGIANMHRATFDGVKAGRPFAQRRWEELPDDPDLAIRAEAWYLHDLARQLPAQHVASLTRDELLALGYNTGPGNMRAFARGVKPGPQAQDYLDRLRSNWKKAGQDVA
ncbi:transglycosylase SLT domain-containing protein [Streptacidiphilus monticola]|uniref:Transglycosylase SLT domain-containing protein n=1 Tax=Streptacidiphilus monticola TaxID=2161674 RepID=A0ABW1G5M4_9ACTN